MGRKKDNNIGEKFTYNPGTNLSTCMIQGCTTKIKGNASSNLEKHLKSAHLKQFEGHVLQKSREVAAGGSNAPDHPLPNKKRQLSMHEVLDTGIKIKMSKCVMREACIELVTVNGRPLSIVQDSGFKKIVGPITDALKMTLSYESVRAMVVKEATKIRQQIATEIRGKLVCLKIDGATRLDRSVLGINIQFMKNSKIQLRTLAIKEMSEKHTAKYLKQVICETISVFGLEIGQIFSITTDNGANMLKAVHLLEEEAEEDISAATMPMNVNENTVDFNMEFDLSAPEDEDITTANEGEDTSETVEDEDIEIPINEMNLDLVYTEEKDKAVLRGVRCAAHTLQLAVEDTMKTEAVHNTLAKARAAAKKLRTPTLGAILGQLKAKKAILDCATRWHSTFYMLERLVELKEICKNLSATHKELHLTNSDWNRMDLLTSALKPAKIATKCLQEEQLTMGDMYREWLVCKLETSRVKTAFATILVNNMNKREAKLLENEAFVSAIYLDPRFQIMLTPARTQMAVNHLVLTWTRLQALSSPVVAVESIEPVEDFRDSDDELEKMLRDRDSVAQSRPIVESLNRNIRVILDVFNNTKRMDKNTNVLEYWKSCELSHPELYNLAGIVLATPATQVSVERLFSGLKFILSPLRTNLKPCILDDGCTHQ